MLMQARLTGVAMPVWPSTKRLPTQSFHSLTALPATRSLSSKPMIWAAAASSDEPQASSICFAAGELRIARAMVIEGAFVPITVGGECPAMQSTSNRQLHCVQWPQQAKKWLSGVPNAAPK